MTELVYVIVTIFTSWLYDYVLCAAKAHAKIDKLYLFQQVKYKHITSECPLRVFVKSPRVSCERIASIQSFMTHSKSIYSYSCSQGWKNLSSSDK